MKALGAVCLLFLAPGLLLAQSSPTNTETNQDNSAVAKELKELREALAEQQKQIAQQQREIQALKQGQNVQDVAAKSENPAPRAIDAALHTSSGGAEIPGRTYSSRQGGEMQKESPLSFRIGGADFTPGGYLDFVAIFRSTNTGNVLSTNYNAIPFNNVVPGRLSEIRLTAQASRFNLKVTDKFGANDVTGYAEMDFNGNDAANVFVSTNSHTARLRLGWLDLKRGKWEILGGQSWSWLTPNRVGLSPNPSDVFITRNYDSNHTVGQTFTRAAQFRVAYHPNDNWAFGVALENPQQFTGAGEVVFPSGPSGLLNAALSVQFDAANNNGTPNLHPDIIPKIAFDSSGHRFHVEAAGLLTTKKVFIPVIPGIVSGTNTATGGAISVNTNVAVIKNFRLLANTYWSDGGGRYLGGLAPDAVVRPDGSLSLVHSGGGVVGFEAQVTPKTLFAGYYGGVYAQHNFFASPTNTSTGGLAGFGFPGSASSANRSLQEGSFDWNQTLWSSPQHGSLQTLLQVSYVTRSPWSVPATQPKNAHLGMSYLALRYNLP